MSPRPPTAPTFNVQYGPNGVQWCSDALLEAVAEASSLPGRRIHMHLFETRYQRGYLDQLYGGDVVKFLDRIGLLSPALDVGALRVGAARRTGTAGRARRHDLHEFELEFEAAFGRAPRSQRCSAAAAASPWESTAARSTTTTTCCASFASPIFLHLGSGFTPKVNENDMLSAAVEDRPPVGHQFARGRPHRDGRAGRSVAAGL